jgi:hypothetical protein
VTIQTKILLVAIAIAALVGMVLTAVPGTGILQKADADACNFGPKGNSKCGGSFSTNGDFNFHQHFD